MEMADGFPSAESWRRDRILLAHGGGGTLTAELVRELILPRFGNDALAPLDDAAVLAAPGGRLAFTTDAFVVSPPFFPGGNIGDLAVCGTVNDLAMAGAKPLWLSLGLILEEGLPVPELEAILDAAKRRADEAGVQVVCGDTKVVAKGQADRLYISTSGIGAIPEGAEVSSRYARPGDALIVSGALGLHGLAVMLHRGNLKIETPIASDVAPLNRAVESLLAGGIPVRALRDITRGGLSMALHDIARNSSVTVELRENDLPKHPAQQAACDLLGLDPLHLPCEGRFLAIVDAARAEEAVAILRKLPVSSAAVLAGIVKPRGRYPVEVATSLGTRRVVTPPRGEQLPRIC
jgi:hydrogenase expression/formation protein HypE